MRIVEATEADAARVVGIVREAFDDEETPGLVVDLLADPTARPLLSLLAFDGAEAIGHILFTAAHLEDQPEVVASILAPLAVVQARQRQGIGGRLIEAGVERLAQAGTDLVFVLGHPGYYPRRGFAPAIPVGLDAPYPITPEEAWMVRALRPGLIGSVSGTVRCANTMAKPEYWRE